MPILSDEELSKYIPRHGDRVRARSCIAKKTEEQSSTSRKNDLLAILRQKLNPAAGNRESTKSSSETSGKRKVTQDYLRQIEIGWICAGPRNKHMRAKQGGGTRKIKVKPSSLKQDLLEIGQEFFFPGGKSCEGHLSDFELDICDFKEQPITEDVTVDELYDQTKFGMLRFYLLSKRKVLDDTSVPCSCHDTTQKSSKRNETSAKKMKPKGNVSKFETVDLTDEKQLTSTSSNDTDMSQAKGQPRIKLKLKSTDLTDNTNQELPDITVKIAAAETAQIGDVPTKAAYSDISDDEGFDFVDAMGMSGDIGKEPDDLAAMVHTVEVHRGMILKDLITGFKKVNIDKDVVELKVILPNGVTELAEDSGGVTRDVLTEFWEAFYEQNTVGTEFKIPFLRHDYGEQDWASVAKVLVYGWKEVHYFPVRLSLPFVEHCLYGVFSSDIVQAFFSTLPPSDIKTLTTALEDMKEVDEEDLMDVLQNHEIKTLPNQANLKRIITEMAHKEIIQASMFVIDCWVPILRNIGLDHASLVALYKDLVPTTRSVAKLLKFPENMGLPEAAVANHLRRFVRELDQSGLCKFLRFCTGSDLCVCDTINVTFVDVQGFTKRPIAHTCSCLLELSKNYDSFPEFRSEFTAILNSGIWIMDIT